MAMAAPPPAPLQLPPRDSGPTLAGMTGGTAAATSAAAGAALLPAARLLEEALLEDEMLLRLDEGCMPGAGSADYESGGPSAFNVAHVSRSAPAPLQGLAPGGGGARQGLLPEIQRVWRASGSQLLLWRYTDPRAPDIMTYEGVTQPIVTAATARPKEFVSGVAYFLAIATPVEVSLHALRFAPGSDRLLPLQRTQHVVATDDVAVRAIASDDSTGRIFLGGADGCIHEMQYYGDEDLSWFGRSKKSRRAAVHRNFQSFLPGFLQKASRALFGASDGVAHLVADSSRGLLFSLSTQSCILIYSIPANRRDSQGRLEEPPLSLLCSISVHTLASEVARTRSQLFPGLAPTRHQFFGSGSFASAMAGQRLRVTKLLPIDKAQGGDVVLCAVVEDGTRVFLRGMYRQPSGAPLGMQGSPGWTESAGSGSAIGTAGSIGNAPQSICNVVVHHVRFLDSSMPALCVRDAVQSDGITLLLGQALSGATPRHLAFQPWGDASGRGGLGGAHTFGSADAFAPHPADGDVLVAISSDLRAVAQRQSLGRAPWLVPPQGLAERVELLRLDSEEASACQAVVLAPLACPLPRPLQFLYERPGASQPVLRLGELARQQLLPPTEFLLVSNLGVHVLTKQRPLDAFRQRLVRGDLPLLRDFALEYTAEQTCALCFQILATAIAEGASAASPRSDASSGMGLGGGRGAQLTPRGLQAGRMGVGSDGGRVGYGSNAVDGYAARQTLDNAISFAGGGGGAIPSAHNPLPRPQFRDQGEELALLRAEHLLLHPQLASQMGFLQTWPGVERQGQQPWPSALGHSIHLRGAQRISGRLRGLCLYLSRVLRPLWLAPVMSVTWPQARPGDSARGKRRRDEWWPLPAEPPPAVEGSQWRCAWSRDQRGFVQRQLLHLFSLLERCSGHLAADGAASAAASKVALGAAGVSGGRQAGVGSDAEVLAGLTALVATSIEALAFLELAAPRADALATANVPAQTLVRFAELTFRDLVCQPEARQVLQQLMCAGLVACRQLHARCPRLFSAADLEVQESYEVLTAAQQGLAAARYNTSGGVSMDHARLAHLVQRALHALERHANRLDLAEVAPRLRAVGAFRGLIALCVRTARARDPRDESVRPMDPASARAQQLHYARLECYQIVLEIFEELLVGLRRHQAIVGEGPALLGLEGSPAAVADGDVAPQVAPGSRVREALPELLPVPIDPSAAAQVLDAFLRHCLEDQAYLADELFHFCVLKWMTQKRLPVYRYDSPYLPGFLETHASDQPELLCRYYQHRGRWAQACDAYLALAKAPGRGVEEQIELLQSAALCAQMPASGRRAEPICRALTDLTRLRSSGGDAIATGGTGNRDFSSNVGLRSRSGHFGLPFAGAVAPSAGADAGGGDAAGGVAWGGERGRRDGASGALR